MQRLREREPAEKGGVDLGLKARVETGLSTCERGGSDGRIGTAREVAAEKSRPGPMLLFLPVRRHHRQRKQQGKFVKSWSCNLL